MQIMTDVYMLSGVQQGTNSNSYAVRAGDELLLFDAGFTAHQYGIMRRTLRFWGLDGLPVRRLFLTHAHFDHAGNAHLWRAAGAEVYAGPGDAEGIEAGDRRTADYWFENRTFTPCKVEGILRDGEEMRSGGVTVTALHMPGHSAGSMMYRIETGGPSLLVMGDFVTISPVGHIDDVKLSLAWTGGPDYSKADYLNSLNRALSFDVDILLPGHGAVYYGDCHDIFQRANEMARLELD